MDSSGDRDLTIALLVWIAGSAAALAVMDPLYRQHFALITVPAAVLVARLRPPMAVVAVVLVVLVRGQAHGADWRLSTPKVTPSEQAMVEVLRRVTPPGSLLISDEPALGWMAERSSPGWLVDTSHVRIDAGELTATEALDAATSPGVCSVLYWTGRLDGLPGLRPGLLEQYRSVWRDGSRELLVRDSCLADGDAPLVRAATPGHT